MLKKKLFAAFLLFLSISFGQASDPWVEVTNPDKLPYFGHFQAGERDRLIQAIDQSLAYLNRKASHYQFPKQGISHELNLRSLLRFKELLESSLNGDALDQQIKKEFKVYRSIGKEENKCTLFTGYYEPIYDGSRTKSEVYQFPLYRIPKDLVLNSKGKVLGRRLASGKVSPKYWTRQEIDQGHKLQNQGLEIVYLKAGYQAYMAQMQGSVAVRLENGKLIHLGYSARNQSTIGFSLPKELHQAGKLTKKELLPHLVVKYFEEHPEDLPKFLEKNTSYVFFTERKEAPLGALSVRLFGESAISTDHRHFPKAALAFVEIDLYKNKKNHPFKRFVLNQDTGGGILGPGRCEIFFGTGEEAEKKANDMYSFGGLYFFFLKD
jgi:membrane-bound lytic murein transglycosylase A